MRRTTLAVVLGIALPTLALGGAWLWTTLAARDARRREQHALLVRSADAVHAAVDESLEELRAREDARPFYLYNHFYTPPEVLSLTATIAVSPLAGEPDDPRVVGYFQVDPGGSVRTPYEAEAGAGSDPRAAQVRDAVSATPLAPLRAYAYLAPGATSDDGPLAPRHAPVVPPPHVTPQAHHVHVTPTFASAGNAGSSAPRQVTVALNSYSNMLYDQVNRAQAGDPSAQAYVAQPRGVQPTERNAVSWEAQAVQQTIDTGNAPPVVPQVTGSTEQATQATRVVRPRTRIMPEPQVLPAPAPCEPDRADAVDYTPMAFATFGDALVLWRVVSHEGASSVQGVVLDRRRVLGDWLPALVRRHALAGASPRVVLGAPGHADLVRPVSDALPGVSLVFPAGTLARVEAADDRAAWLQALGLLGLVLAIVVTGVVVDRAARRSAALAQQRSAFVSAVSHELRTPLTTIRMHAEMLRDGLVPEGKRAKFHSDIAQESVRLARLVENVLEATRLEEGRRPVRLSEGDLAAHVRHVASGQRALCESRGAKLSVVVPDAMPARFDAQAVELVVVNLVENAVKHGLGEKREVDVELVAKDGGAELHVRDRGAGVPSAEREKVFERFHRVERPGAEHVVGTGLGLALVRELARAHGGDARVAARDGGGADFVVTLRA